MHPVPASIGDRRLFETRRLVEVLPKIFGFTVNIRGLQEPNARVLAYL